MQISHALCSTCWRSGPQSRGSGTTRPEKNNHPPGLVGRGDLMADFTIMVGGEGGGGGLQEDSLAWFLCLDISPQSIHFGSRGPSEQGRLSLAIRLGYLSIRNELTGKA